MNFPAGAAAPGISRRARQAPLRQRGGARPAGSQAACGPGSSSGGVGLRGPAGRRARPIGTTTGARSSSRRASASRTDDPRFRSSGPSPAREDRPVPRPVLSVRRISFESSWHIMLLPKTSSCVAREDASPTIARPAPDGRRARTDVAREPAWNRPTPVWRARFAPPPGVTLVRAACRGLAGGDVRMEQETCVPSS